MFPQKLKKIITVSVSLLFILSLVAINSNLHFHFNNNFLFFHSHPYDKSHNDSSPIKSHEHSSSELLLYFSAIHIDTIVFFALAILTLTLLIKYLSIVSSQIIYTNPTYLFAVLRAPPLASL